jgi:hypothetical protein
MYLILTWVYRKRRKMMNGNKADHGSTEKEKEIVFFIDNEKFETDQATLTARTLLVDYAKEDATQTTLALRHGNDIKKYANPDEPVAMKNGMKFIVFHNTPTSVS